MRKLPVITTLILVLLFNILFTTSVQAANDVNLNITGDSFLEQFDPNKTDKAVTNMTEPVENTIIVVVNYALGILQVVGALLSVLSVAIFGYNKLLGSNKTLFGDLGISIKYNSPNEKISMLNFGRGMLIGSILLFSSTTIVKIVMDLLTKS